MFVVESEKDYRSKQDRFLSFHRLRDFQKSPLIYHLKVTGVLPEVDTPAMAFGRAAHVLILQGREIFNTQYVVADGPVNPKTGEPYGRQTKAYREWAEKQEKNIIGREEMTTLENMLRAVAEHECAQKLLCDGGFVEAVVRAEYCGIPCQARIDLLAGSRLVELKTCEDLDWFEHDLRKYGYIHQLAFYTKLIEIAEPSDARVSLDQYIIAVEKQPPHRVGVWTFTADVMAKATIQNEAALRDFRECKEQNHWPTRYETIRVVSIL
ncbi:MAG: PD-(D/E)XK nuclease-like domain-containing protein [Planctomycetota bacterium]|nr:PD-(D/E)XK nuclease-like domain-containing protein [Planctomycetota bacterium]